jgi:lysophospholipase L1-like esterase
VLCYGDSNTWGYEPATGERFPEGVRWPGVLQGVLGEGFRVVEEALNGRTTVHDDPIEEHRNGRTYLRPCLESHAPLDLVVIALGVNDLKARFGLSASDVADGVSALASIAKTSGAGPGGKAPEVLVVVPPPVGRLTDAAQMFRGAEEKSRDFSEQYRRVARQRGCALLDAGRVVVSSDEDGIHLEAAGHRKLGEAVAARTREMLGGGE